jgi:hypothetical protein
MARRSIGLAALIALLAGCGARQARYEPLSERGRACLNDCESGYQTCLANCFASTNCMELCIGERKDCLQACPDLRRE